MKKTKISIILLISVVIFILMSCGAMMEGSGDLTIDLSALSSDKASGDEYVTIWLVFSDTYEFFDLDKTDLEKKYKFVKLPSTGIVTLENIPLGYEYDLYLTKGDSLDGTVSDFTAEKYFVETVVASEGSTETPPVVTVQNIVTIAYDEMKGKNLGGVTIVSSTLYTIDKTTNTLYFDSAADPATAFSEAGDAIVANDGFTFNSVTEGMGNLAMISSKNDDGYGVVSFDGDFSDDPAEHAGYNFSGGLTGNDDINGLPVLIEGENKAVNILNSDIYWDDTENLEVILGYTEGGAIISIRDTDGDGSHTWIPLDFGSKLDGMGISLVGRFLKGVTTVFDKSGSTLENAYVYLITSAGNFQFTLPLTSDIDEDAIMELFKSFEFVDSSDNEYVIQNIGTPDNSKIFIGTDRGLLQTTAASDISTSAPELISATAGDRIELLACGASYTACVTPLNLVIVDGTGDTAVIPFNAGLPSNGLLTDGGITGLDWDGSTLYVSGNNGLVKLDASTLTYN